MFLTYETEIYSNAVEQEVHLYYVPSFPFIYPCFVNGSQEKAHGSLQSFKSMAVLKYLRHFFDFINKSASWTSVVLSLTWKL